MDLGEGAVDSLLSFKHAGVSLDDQLLRTSTKVAEELQRYGAPAEIIRLQKSFQSALEGVAFTYGSALLLEYLVMANNAIEDVAGVALSDNFPIEATSIVSFDSLISNIRTGAYCRNPP